MIQLALSTTAVVSSRAAMLVSAATRAAVATAAKLGTPFTGDECTLGSRTTRRNAFIRLKVGDGDPVNNSTNSSVQSPRAKESLDGAVEHLTGLSDFESNRWSPRSALPHTKVG